MGDCATPLINRCGCKSFGGFFICYLDGRNYYLKDDRVTTNNMLNLIAKETQDRPDGVIFCKTGELYEKQFYYHCLRAGRPGYY